jgi:hypothetical protein
MKATVLKLFLIVAAICGIILLVYVQTAEKQPTDGAENSLSSKSEATTDEDSCANRDVPRKIKAGGKYQSIQRWADADGESYTLSIENADEFITEQQMKEIYEVCRKNTAPNVEGMYLYMVMDFNKNEISHVESLDNDITDRQRKEIYTVCRKNIVPDEKGVINLSLAIWTEKRSSEKTGVNFDNKKFRERALKILEENRKKQNKESQDSKNK